MGFGTVIAQNGAALPLNTSVLNKTPRDCTALPGRKMIVPVGTRCTVPPVGVAGSHVYTKSTEE